MFSQEDAVFICHAVKLKLHKWCFGCFSQPLKTEAQLP